MPHSRVKTTSKLSRVKSQRKALLKSLAYHLIMEESITTTKPKAKALIPFVEKLITRAKKGTLHSRRQVVSKLGNTEAADKLFEELLPKLKSRNSGHVRIKPAGFRQGDQAILSEVSLILDAPAAKTEKKPAQATKSKAGSTTKPQAAAKTKPAKKEVK